MSLKQNLPVWRARVDQTLQAALLPGEDARLREAMSYSLFNGGKRLRPVLCYGACEALGGDLALADAAAAAVECIHAYSLVHDDLPAMDDDALRRGKPTCHIAYDEATAILAGDALQALAFELLSTAQGGQAPALPVDPAVAVDPAVHLDPVVQLEMLRTLALQSGHQGMVAGQGVDMASAGSPISCDTLERMHRLKTGALIRASVRLGGLAAAASASQLAALDRYAAALGLAFQVQDDILDIEGDTQTLGKPQGSDLAADKSTYPALLGMAQAKRLALSLHEDALDALTSFDRRAGTLRDLADYVIHRDH